ncbi:MAG TPA: maleylpyruvate isomerase family mycothiol-dependent enzyme [Streptosporangiaceae bacterium]|nr:maleylpyruvate isomerase family mycothiol-dependent enzyme [Streptosporangiaceae bacterium]
MEISEHITALTEQGPLLAAAAAAAGPDAPVPSCPDWLVRDLVRHQGGVHRWAASIVGTPRTEPWDVDLDDVVGTWPADDELVAWFSDGCRELVGVLEQADPGLYCWTFLPAPSPLAMWARRQAHETAVHRVDAELAAGTPVTPFQAPFAADGIDELLSCSITRQHGRLRSDDPKLLRVRCAEGAGEWLVSIGPDGARTTAGAEGPDGDCLVAGTADDLYLALWRRRAPDVLEVEGDGGVLDLFLDKVQVRWS